MLDFNYLNLPCANQTKLRYLLNDSRIIFRRLKCSIHESKVLQIWSTIRINSACLQLLSFQAFIFKCNQGKISQKEKYQGKIYFTLHPKLCNFMGYINAGGTKRQARLQRQFRLSQTQRLRISINIASIPRYIRTFFIQMQNNLKKVNHGNECQRYILSNEFELLQIQDYAEKRLYLVIIYIFMNIDQNKTNQSKSLLLSLITKTGFFRVLLYSLHMAAKSLRCLFPTDICLGSAFKALKLCSILFKIFQTGYFLTCSKASSTSGKRGSYCTT